MTFPDLVAFPLEEAVQKIKESRCEFEVQKTYSVKSFNGNGKWRVVRQRTKDGKLILTTAEECAGILS